MTRTMMSGKIHRATVTGANVDYVGSVSLDPELMAAADILQNEQVHVLDVTNGHRLETYVIEGAPGEVCLNGAAARLVGVGDLVIIVAYQQMGDEAARKHKPKVILVDKENRIVDKHAVRAA